MRRFVFAALALASCAPQPAPADAPDPLAMRYEVKVGQAVLPNVRSVAISGPDIELVEFRQGGQPGASTLIPGRVGMVKLVITTDWAAAEQTMETWRLAITGAGQGVAPTHRTIIVAVTSPGGSPPANYSFNRCLMGEHQMQLGAQDARIEQVWRVTCESVQRT